MKGGIIFNILGFKFKNTVPSILLGKMIRLIPESNSIKVLADEVHVAYVVKKDCTFLHNLLKDKTNNHIYYVNVNNIYKDSAKCTLIFTKIIDDK